MEEDIKILEALNETLMKDKFIIPKEPRIWCEALENAIKTIKAHKELEYKYDKALSDLVQAEHENKELKEENRSYEDEIQEQAKDLMFCEETIRDEHIPISLVKEKIEFLEINILDNEYASDNDKDIAEYQAQVLQELLEKRE